MMQGPSSKPILLKVVLKSWALMKFGEMLIKEVEETEWTVKQHGIWVIDYGEVEGFGYQRKWHCDRSHVVPSLTLLLQQN